MSPQRFSIVFLTLLVLHFFCGKKIFGQTDERPEYIFDDTRVSHADSLVKQKDYAGALGAYQKVATTYKSGKFYEGVIYATERAAYCYRKLGKDSLSALTFQKAIDLAKTELEPNHMLLSKAYLNNGLRLYGKNSKNQSVIHFDSAMIHYSLSKFQKPSSYKSIIEFKYYSYLFSENSVDTMFKYLDLRNSYLKNNSSTISELAYLFSDYSRAYIKSGDFEKAQLNALEAVKLCEMNQNEIPFAYYSDALFVLGHAYQANSQYDKILSVSNRLIPATYKSDPRSAGLPGYHNLKGVALNGLKKYSQAEKEFKTALSLIEKQHVTNKDFYNTVMMNLGVCYRFKGEFKKSEYTLKKALKNSKSLSSTSDADLSARHSYLSTLYAQKEQYEISLLHCDSSLFYRLNGFNISSIQFPELQEDNISLEIVNLLIKRSKILFRRSQQLNQASSVSLSSIQTYVNNTHQYISKGRRQLQNSKVKIWQSKEFKELYEVGLEIFNISHSKNSSPFEIEFALNTMSKSKSLFFLDQLGEHYLLKNSSLPLFLKSEFSNTKFILDSLDSKIDGKMRANPLGDSIMSLNLEKMKWNAKLAKIRKTIEEEYPDAGNDFFNKGVTIAFLRKDHQLSDQKALVEYFVGDSVIFVIGLSGHKESFRRIKKDKALNEALSGFLGEINTRPDLAELESHLQRYRESGSILYQKLLQPVMDDLGNPSELVIVPDEILSRLPFEMLVTSWTGKETSFKDLNYLLKEAKVSHLLSSRISFNDYAKKQGKGLLGFGYLGDSIVDERAAMGALPGALKEIDFLKSRFKGDFYIGKEGTKRQFLDKANDYDIIHLALHGKSDSVNRYNSALVFNGDQDYYMTSTDLYRTQLQSKLAVLSACESGIGKISEGEGSFSIARGFAIAGVPAIVTTLWRVNDEAGANIMQEFYMNLQAGDKKDEALRKAKVKYLEESDNLTASPYFWGSYILIGDTSTIELPTKGSFQWYWVLLTMIFLGGLGLGLRRLSRKSFDKVA